jgi:copper chaperone
MRQLKLEVAGMSCNHCVQAVRDALGSVPGVKVEAVQVGSASVSYDESKAKVGDLIDAVYNAGYEANEAA